MTFSQQDTNNLKRIADALERIANRLDRTTGAEPQKEPPKCNHYWRLDYDVVTNGDIRQCAYCGEIWPPRSTDN